MGHPEAFHPLPNLLLSRERGARGNRDFPLSLTLPRQGGEDPAPPRGRLSLALSGLYLALLAHRGREDARRSLFSDGLPDDFEGGVGVGEDFVVPEAEDAEASGFLMSLDGSHTEPICGK